MSFIFFTLFILFFEDKIFYEIPAVSFGETAVFFKLRDDSNSNLNVDSLLFQPYNLNSISFYMILVFEKGSFKNGFMRKVKDR